MTPNVHLFFGFEDFGDLCPFLTVEPHCQILFLLLCVSHRMRVDVITTTDWLAPVIWEGTFDREALEKYYRKQNITVGLVVFAVGR